MKQDQVVYKHRIGSYVYVYDALGFIHVFDSDNVEDTTTQCLKTYKCHCKNKKDFEMEVLYLHSHNGFDTLTIDVD
jgi:hypothetical protein